MTELIWDRKYDAQGCKVAPPRIALPFQTVETVNESAADRDRNRSFFAGGPSRLVTYLVWPLLVAACLVRPEPLASSQPLFRGSGLDH